MSMNMSRAEKLASRLAGNMKESLGVRLIASEPQAAVAAPGGIPSASPEEGRTRDRLAGHMEIDRIAPDPDQPRKYFSEESIAQLSASLQRTGQLQPIRVRWSEEHGKWIIISGERRYRAALLAGLRTVSCAFTDRPLTESEIRQESLIENLLREDLRPIEAANGYRQIMDLNGWTMQQVAEALNVSKGAVSKALSLLRLPEDVQEQVEQGVISPSSGYEVSRLKDERAQRELAARIVGEGLKRDDAGAAVGKAARPKAKKERAAGVVEAGPTTTRTFAVADARLTITWSRRSVEARDVVLVLEEALAQLRGRGVESDAA
ncbi:ParB/RepB/Spo0J family partition protein [Planctomyces sp. SH-PL62]|uniref:ParB/RepB/Spo0J family partition protein n=1 Tax=Planctomyces sp. SH-PL62 TaxID=1636152 RepID=UPI00078BBDA6|nr:ParB/RepB/Spo0J family partition protein [Planctomyces sp. SH-PL62]AMV40959.1 Chromosome-partitioning protein Spo0J [Planctomyces sp. SH-PL62]